MTDFFSEKAHQIDPYSLISFGIPIESRYAKASEIIEMINFTKALAESNVSHYVKLVNFDSKSSCCFIYISPDVQKRDLVDQKIRKAAEENILFCENSDAGYLYEVPPS